MIDVRAIKVMLSDDRVNDLLDLMEGESKFTTGSSENMPITEEERIARGDALDHVRFVAKYGLTKERVIEGSKIYSARPEGFAKWLELGAPGIEAAELSAYLEKYPL